MAGSRFLWQLYAGYALLILFTAAIIGGLVASRIARDSRDDIDRQLQNDAAILRHAIAAGLTDARLADWLASFDQDVSTRLTVIRADGLVLADSERDPATMDDHGDRPEILEARDQGLGAATRFSQTLGKPMRYLALPLRQDGQLVAYARASIPLASLDARLADLRRVVLIGAILPTLVALLLAYFVARRVTQPLHTMTTAVDAMAQGDDGETVQLPSRRDELGTLARAFRALRIRLQDQLEASTLAQGRLSAILGSMVEGVVAVDGSERIVHMSEVAARFFDVDAVAVTGRPIWEITRHREVSEALFTALEERTPSQRELRIPGRPEKIIELRAMPLRGAAGDRVLRGAVLVLDDVTQLRRLETVRQDFVGNVSHELKTPVTAIRGLVETMLDDDAMPPEIQRSFLSKIGDQTKRLSTLVHDLLSLSRLDAHHGQLLVEPVDLRNTIDDAVAALQPSIEARSLTVETRLPDEPVPILAEAEALREAVENLLTNAVKYSPTDRPVEICLDVVDDEPDDPELPKMASVTVRDHGPGIPSHHQERIFERFYRVDNARSRALGGTGLGLAIVKHIALDLGGDVSVESAPGAGATFRIRLPIAA